MKEGAKEVERANGEVRFECIEVTAGRIHKPVEVDAHHWHEGESEGESAEQS